MKKLTLIVILLSGVCILKAHAQDVAVWNNK
jgi:hypothetical protein